MGFVGGLLGTSGGASGSGFNAPQAAPLNPGLTADQLGTAYTGAQNSLGSQQALLAALQGQNGLQNQSQVYGQLQGVANGVGPNPAQAMLNQSTGQNVANQAALMGSARGANANAGLIGRQAAQQGAQIQQNAAGQAATLQANQQMGALGQMGSLANQQAANYMTGVAGNSAANQSEQQILQNANSQYNNTAAAMQGNINTNNAALAATNMQGQQGIVGGVANGLGAVGSSLLKGNGNNNGTNSDGTTTGTAVPPAPGESGVSGASGDFQMRAQGGMIRRMAAGGPVDTSLSPFQPMTQVQFAAPQAAPLPSGPQSSAGQFINNVQSNGGQTPGMGDSGSKAGGPGSGSSLTGGIGSLFGAALPLIGSAYKGLAGTSNNTQTVDTGNLNTTPTPAAPGPGGITQPSVGAGSSSGGTEGPDLSPPSSGPSLTTSYGANPGAFVPGPNGTIIANPGRQQPTMGYQGGQIQKTGSKLKAGGPVPGKAKVSGNSLKNDNVQALLSPGEVVIPRSVMQSANPAEGAARFVAAVLAHKKGKK